MENGAKSEWFCNWFNTPYYHILYKNRSTSEAEVFIENLLTRIQLPDHSKIVDVACGKGRHAIYLNKKGYDVTGIDISAESIRYAKAFENENLNFAVHDMRKPFITNYFDAAINLFTSIGYFKTERENELAIKTMCMALKKNGIIVIDFLNAITTMKKIVPEEEKTIDGITFIIKKQLKAKILSKDIVFEENGKHYNFTEEVQLLELTDFEKYFKAAGLKILNLYGDYYLNTFNPLLSDRLILVGFKL